MINSNRDIMVLLKKKDITDDDIMLLHQLLHTVESPEQFCLAHELVDRNRITRKPGKIIKETRHYYMRAFRFLINKN